MRNRGYRRHFASKSSEKKYVPGFATQEDAKPFVFTQMRQLFLHPKQKHRLHHTLLGHAIL
jgi:hypothetical protein